MSLNNISKKINFTVVLVFVTFYCPLFVNHLYAQTNNSLQTGSSNSLKIQLSNTIGVTTTADSTDNLDIDNQAILILEPGSTIQDSFGEGETEAENMSVSFDISPTGSNVGISGLKAKNNYIIGEGTFFSSSMKTKGDIENDQPVKGSASAGMYHDMSLKVDQVSSSFTSSFSQNF